MESLISRIYHEKQQEGSMLCAQHALNSMLRTCPAQEPDLC
jgi:ataxin-3